MAVDDSGGDDDVLEVGRTRVLTQHLERAVLIDGVAFHQDALGTLGERLTTRAANRDAVAVAIELFGRLVLIRFGGRFEAPRRHPRSPGRI